MRRSVAGWVFGFIVALVLSAGVVADDFTVDLSPEKRPSAEACRRVALERFAVDNYRFQVLRVLVTQQETSVWLELGPAGSPRRYRLACTYRDEWGNTPSVAWTMPAPPSR